MFMLLWQALVALFSLAMLVLYGLALFTDLFTLSPWGYVITGALVIGLVYQALKWLVHRL